MADAMILPVSIDIVFEENLGMAQNKLKTFLYKPDAIVRIGEPFFLEKIESIERMKELMDKRKNGLRLTHEEVSEFSQLSKNLREQSQVLMKKLAEITPEEKGGAGNY
jgi:hypothetical protein